MTTERSNLIKSIYIYLFTAIGLGMFLIGSYNLIQFATRKFILPKYYLDYQESRCDYISQPAPMAADGTTKPVDQAAAEPMEEQKKQCLKRLEEDRANQQVIQLSSSLTLILLGGATFWFHYKKTGLGKKEETA